MSGARAVDRVEALIHNEILCLLRKLHSELLFFETAFQIRHKQIHNLEDLRALQRLVEHNLVEAVQEFGAELLPQQRLHVCLRLVADRALRRDTFQNRLRTEVRGEDDDRILEVYRASLAVGV